MTAAHSPSRQDARPLGSLSGPLPWNSRAAPQLLKGGHVDKKKCISSAQEYHTAVANSGHAKNKQHNETQYVMI